VKRRQGKRRIEAIVKGKIWDQPKERS